jgi:hypothetical protein
MAASAALHSQRQEPRGGARVEAVTQGRPYNLTTCSQTPCGVTARRPSGAASAAPSPACGAGLTLQPRGRPAARVVSGLLIDQNAVIVRDARDGDRIFVAATTVRRPALRLQCVTAVADRDIPTAILERTWLVHPLKIQVTFHVHNPLNQDPRVVERPVGAAALCIERDLSHCGNPDVLAGRCKSARGDGLGPDGLGPSDRRVRDWLPSRAVRAPIISIPRFKPHLISARGDLHLLRISSFLELIRADQSAVSDSDAEFRPGQNVPTNGAAGRSVADQGFLLARGVNRPHRDITRKAIQDDDLGHLGDALSPGVPRSADDQDDEGKG